MCFGLSWWHDKLSTVTAHGKCLLGVHVTKQEQNFLCSRLKNISEDMDTVVPEIGAFSPHGGPYLLNLPLLFLEGSFNQEALIRSTT